MEEAEEMWRVLPMGVMAAGLIMSQVGRRAVANADVEGGCHECDEPLDRHGGLNSMRVSGTNQGIWLSSRKMSCVMASMCSRTSGTATSGSGHGLSWANMKTINCSRKQPSSSSMSAKAASSIRRPGFHSHSWAGP